jgi:hypothetical protein
MARFAAAARRGAWIGWNFVMAGYAAVGGMLTLLAASRVRKT